MENKSLLSPRSIIAYVYDALSKGRLKKAKIDIDAYKGPTKIIIEVEYEEE